MDVDYNPEDGKVGGGYDAIFKLKRYDFQIFFTSKENDYFQTSMAILLPSNYLTQSMKKIVQYCTI